MEEKFITLKNNLKIHYLTAGSTDNPPLILLHGWPTNCYLWRHIIPELSDNFYILAPDLPGHGLSDRPDNGVYDLDFFNDFLTDFYDTMCLEKAHLAVHDLGAIAGISFAVRSANCIDKLIIMNTGPYKELPVILNLFLQVLNRTWLTRLFLTKFMFKLVLMQGFYRKQLVTQTVFERYRQPWLASKKTRQSFAKTIAVPIQEIVEPVEQLHNIDLDTLILWGTKDAFFHFSTARRLHKDIKRSKLVAVPEAGHFLLEEKPEMVSKQLLEFLNCD
ncbi:MAG: alpha/beta hydrolase [Desulfobacteraceae bacterium]|nr:alpha/beta hydrolase [Desulfobacteraceae bacterium]